MSGGQTRRTQNQEQPSVVRRSLASLTLAGLVVIGALAAPATSATTPQRFTYVEAGEGKVQGLDFAAVGTLRSEQIGVLSADTSSDSLSVAFERPANGEMVMTSRGVVVLSAATDQIFATERGTYRFKALTLPDGTVLPDLSREVAVSVAMTITGGTGRFAEATGTMTATGTINPQQISPDPTAVNSVTYRFTGTGEVSPRSGGSMSPPRVSFTDAQRSELVNQAKKMPTNPGPLPAGVYTAEMTHWTVTFRVGEGWRNNGVFAESIGLTNGPLANPASTGLLILDDPAIFDDVHRPTRVSSTRVDAADWLRGIDGMTVGDTTSVYAGAPGRSVTFSYKATSPSQNVLAMFAIRAARTYAPLYSGQRAEMHTFDSPGTDRLVVTAAGGLDPRRTIDAQLIMVERR